eukprot:CAMPEP_0116128318 /NCGR_PEP_ID=MMETSP0329-20121206/7299_1 /TAXON_ID=697910 /ORGANISM="Pseudo-nitzschia arenysensis, Strain B593" /LENGTH=449 /DNA_ID=CAMNT_0003622455 /DNA_START=45 /DNA_END=1391 /DNA_ORIENTATION=-
MNIFARITGRKNRVQRIQQPGFQRSSSPPAFLKCSTRICLAFLGVLTIVYLKALLSFFAVDQSLERIPNETRIQAQREPRFDNEVAQIIDDNEKPIIGVASTITGCGEDPFVDGAAVLKYNLDILSQRPEAKFRYKNYVFYHPNATSCVLPLKDLGYTLLERPTPVKVEEIGGDGGLRERISTNGCCGEKELIKLEAFRLTDHPLVIHLDLDVIIPKPLDDVLDFMLNPRKYKRSPDLLKKIPIMWPDKHIPDNIHFMFTKDYGMVAPRRSDKPYQGGFFVIKPNVEAYKEFVDIVKSGNYNVKKGWGDKVGPFYGGMTIQGLFPYYFEYIRGGISLELNRCKINNMNDNPYLKRDNGKEVCRTNEDKCENCQSTNPDDVITFHFTICQKPWNCLGFNHNHDTQRLCRDMNQKWYELRSGLEASWGRNGTGQGSYKFDRYKGYCTTSGK